MKLSKAKVKNFYHVLNKLTDNRFSFNIIHNHKHSSVNEHCAKYCVEMYFCDIFINSVEIVDNDFSIECAVDCLIDLIDSIDLENDYLKHFGISFEIYFNCLSGKPYYLFRKNAGGKWVKISKDLASFLMRSCRDILTETKIFNYVSYSQYDSVSYFNIKTGYEHDNS